MSSPDSPAAPRPREGRRRRDLAELALIALGAGLPLSLGSAPFWVLWPLVALSGGALLFAWWGAGRHMAPWPALAAFPLAAAGLCALQLIPLPVPLLNLLSPQAAALRDFALEPLGLGGAWPVSLDPPSTWRAAAEALSCAAVFVATAQLARSRERRGRLFSALALVGGGVSAIGIGHFLFGAKRLFGLLAFHWANPPVLTPFGNPNHLAAFLTLVGPIALGLAVRESARPRRVLWATCAVFSGIATCLSLSRGGIAFYFLANVLFLVALWRANASTRGTAPFEASRGERGAARFRLNRGLILALGALFLAATMAADLAGESIASELSTAAQLSQSKIALWPNLFRAALRFWPFGMGRGAFAYGYPRFQHVVGVSFTHPENAVLQLLLGFGLLPTSGLLALAVWGCRKLGQRALTAPELGALCGLVGLLAHDMLDFSLELPACAIAAWIVLGILLRENDVQAHPDRAEGTRRIPSRRRWAPVLALTPLLAASFAKARAPRAEEALWNRVRAGNSDVAARAKRAIAHHPADDVLYTAMGWSLLRTDPAKAMAWFERALYLRPWSPEAHLGVARLLRASGRVDQALLAYRLACEGAGGRGVASKFFDEAVPLANTEERLETLVGSSASGLRSVASRLWRAGRKMDAAGLWTWALGNPAFEPARDGLWVAAAQASLGVDRPKEAYARAGERLKIAPGDSAALLVQVRALEAEQRSDEASRLLTKASDLHPDDERLALALAHREVRAKRPRQAETVLHRLSPYVSGPRARSRLMTALGDAYWAEKRLNRALASYVLAARLAPDVAGYHFRVARAAESLHRIDQAISAVREGASLQGPAGEASAKAWVARLRTEAAALERLRLEHAP